MLQELLKNKRVWLITAVSVLAAVLVGLIVLACILGSRPDPKPEKTKKPNPMPESVLDKTEVAPMDFVYDGDYLTCTTRESVLGIDVSGFQGTIDWQQVKDAGIRFAMIRVGGRGYGQEGSLYADSKAPGYYQGAKEAGLQIGAYFFSQATNPEEAVEEAEYALSLIQDWELDLPLVCDWEYMGPDTYGDKATRRSLTDSMKAFCQTVEAGGHEPMIYFNPDHAEEEFYLEEMKDYRFWLAYYTDWMDYPYRVDMWQYTSTGSVPGIQGNVDLNLYFPPIEE